MSQCLVCKKITERLSKHGVCFRQAYAFNNQQCADFVCSCGGIMKNVANQTVYGCSCDDMGKTVIAAYCEECKKGKILT